MSGEFHSIRSSFGRMFFKVRKITTKSSPPLEDLKQFLNDCYRNLRPQLVLIDGLSEALRLIEEECTLIDIEPLQAVVEEFEITEAERYIKEYKTVMEEFCQSISVRLCLKESFEAVRTHPPLRCETATYVFDWEPDEHNLKDIRDILSKSSGRFVKTRIIDTTHSISITCTFHYSLIGAVFTKSIENIEMLKENGLMELTVGYSTIWKRGEVRAVLDSLLVHMLYHDRRYKYRQMKTLGNHLIIEMR